MTERIVIPEIQQWALAKAEHERAQRQAADAAYTMAGLHHKVVAALGNLGLSPGEPWEGELVDGTKFMVYFTLNSELVGTLWRPHGVT